jgi:hypothetical protein
MIKITEILQTYTLTFKKPNINHASKMLRHIFAMQSFRFLLDVGDL